MPPKPTDRSPEPSLFLALSRTEICSDLPAVHWPEFVTIGVTTSPSRTLLPPSPQPLMVPSAKTTNKSGHKFRMEHSPTDKRLRLIADSSMSALREARANDMICCLPSGSTGHQEQRKHRGPQSIQSITLRPTHDWR